jgi:Uma2 family endonuclease
MAVQTQRITVEQFDQLVTQPAYADRLLEYIRGEMVEVVSNQISSHIATRIVRRLAAFVEDRDLGYLTGADGGYMVAGERYIPDVAFVSKARQPELSDQPYNPTPPDLAVEVLSPTNDPGHMRIKIGNYLTAGTTVWVVDPGAKLVEVYAPGQPVRVVGEDESLDGGESLPGFSLAVREIFPT